MAWRCVASLLAGPEDSVWSPAEGETTRRRLISGGPGPRRFVTAYLHHSLVCYKPLARPSSSRPRAGRAADGLCGSLRSKALVRSARAGV